MTSRYGPHDERTAPDSVVVLEAQRWPQRSGIVVPLPDVLVRQRRELNTRAARDE